MINTTIQTSIGRNIQLTTIKACYDEVNPIDELLKQLEHYWLENKITQEMLAKELVVAFSTITRCFNGTVKPRGEFEKFLMVCGL